MAAFLHTYLLVALGIVISVVLPILRQYFPKVTGPSVEGVSTIWPIAKPYIALGIGSLLTSVLIMAFAGDSLNTWKAALLAGYAWDSTLQKIVKPS
jgi:hypothetical protein